MNDSQDERVDDEPQFWTELERVLAMPYTTLGQVEASVRAYIDLAADYGGEYLVHEGQIQQYCRQMLDGPIFAAHADQVRRIMTAEAIDSECGVHGLHMLYMFFVLDGARDPQALVALKHNNFLPSLMFVTENLQDDAFALQRLAMVLLFELCRIERFTYDELHSVREEFIVSLFNFIETGYEPNDPYNVNCVHLILALNEQFMVAQIYAASLGDDDSCNSIEAPPERWNEYQSKPLRNIVLEALKHHGGAFKAFGENLVFLLNREREMSFQLLLLKMLYVIFTTPETAAYFYTNDLCVLVDIFSRELYDLPEDQEMLRLTFLRVLYPLLTRTPLSRPPYYRVSALARLFCMLARETLASEMMTLMQNAALPERHQAQIDFSKEAETIRLVLRCARIPWIAEAATATASAAGSENSTESDTNTVMNRLDECQQLCMQRAQQTVAPAVPPRRRRTRSVNSRTTPAPTGRTAASPRRVGRHSRSGSRGRAVEPLAKPPVPKRRTRISLSTSSQSKGESSVPERACHLPSVPLSRRLRRQQEQVTVESLPGDDTDSYSDEASEGDAGEDDVETSEGENEEDTLAGELSIHDINSYHDMNASTATLVHVATARNTGASRQPVMRRKAPAVPVRRSRAPPAPVGALAAKMEHILLKADG